MYLGWRKRGTLLEGSMRHYATTLDVKSHRSWVVLPLLAALGLLSILSTALPLRAQIPGTGLPVLR